MADLQLIWTNCKTYNQPDSIISGMAVYLENLTKKIAGKLKIIQPEPEQEELKDLNIPSFDDKFAVIEKAKKLPAEEMSTFVKELREICPKAVESKDKRIQIQLDNLGIESLALLNEKLDSMLNKSEAVSSEDRSEAVASNKDEADSM